MILFSLLLPAIILFLLSFITSKKVIKFLPYGSFLILIPIVYLFLTPKPISLLGDYLVVDKLNSYVLLISSIVGIGVSFSLLSLKKRVDLSELAHRRFYRFFGTFWFGLILSIVANNMGIYWIGLEMATLSTVYMIKTNSSNSAHKAAWNYMIVGTIAISLILFGIVMIYASGRALLNEDAMNFTALLKNAQSLPSPFLFEIGFSFVLVGMFVKMGFFPMGLWLPNIERASFYPVAALFSGILESAILIGFFRFSTIAMEVNYGHLFWLTSLYMIVTLFIVSALIFRSKDFMRIFSLSGIEHTALISFFWVSGGVFAALLHLGAHAFIKPALFLSAGALESKGKSKIAGSLRGFVGKDGRLFTLFVSFFILAIISLPPSPLFFSELAGFGSLLDVAKESSHTLVVIAILVALLLFLSAIFYKFITIFQSALFEGKEIKKEVYINEIIALLILFIGTVSLLLPQTIEFLKGLQQ